MNNKHLSWYKEVNNNFIIASRAYFLQSPTCTRVRMELKRLLMCLVLLWNLDSFAKAIAPVLSQKIFIGPDALGMTPRSDMKIPFSVTDYV